MGCGLEFFQVGLDRSDPLIRLGSAADTDTNCNTPVTD